MPAPIDKAVRAAILKDIKAGDKSAHAIAKQHGVAQSTVSKIASDEGCADAFDRSKSREATRARKADTASRAADLAARRLALAEALQGDAERLRGQLWKPHTYFDWGGKDHEFDKHEAPEPIPADKRALMGALSVAVDKSLKLAPAEQDQQGLAAVDQWLRGMMGGSDEAG